MSKSTIIPEHDGTFWISTTCKKCKTEFGFLENSEREARVTADLITFAKPICLDCFGEES